MTATVAIYALTDPRTGADRYIGKANDAARRFKGHLRDARRRDTPVYRWIRKLEREGMVPGMRVLGMVKPERWQEAEGLFIERARREALKAGTHLLNVSAGGDQPFCSTETRAENGRRNAAAIHSDPFRKKIWKLKQSIGLDLKQGYMSNAARAKLRQAARDCPELFGAYAAIPDREENPDGSMIWPQDRAA